jgi:hypothetical protein
VKGQPRIIRRTYNFFAKSTDSTVEQCTHADPTLVCRVSRVLTRSLRGGLCAVFHVPCWFYQQLRARENTHRLDDMKWLNGRQELSEDDQSYIQASPPPALSPLQWSR